MGPPGPVVRPARRVPSGCHRTAPGASVDTLTRDVAERLRRATSQRLGGGRDGRLKGWAFNAAVEAIGRRRRSASSCSAISNEGSTSPATTTGSSGGTPTWRRSATGHRPLIPRTADEVEGEEPRLPVAVPVALPERGGIGSSTIRTTRKCSSCGVHPSCWPPNTYRRTAEGWRLERFATPRATSGSSISLTTASTPSSRRNRSKREQAERFL